MSPWIYLWHAGLGLLCLPTVALSGSRRALPLRALAALGVAGAGACALLPESSLMWRSVGDAPAVTVAALGVGAAWALFLVSDTPRLEPGVGALVGAGGTALLLAAANEWLVPGLLFWVCSSLALGGMALRAPGRGGAWVALFASDAVVLAALVVAAREADTWRLPTGLEGWPLYALLGGGALRAGAVPFIGPWGLLDDPAAPGIPLLTGGGSALVASFSGGEGVPLAGIVLVLGSIAAGLSGMRGPSIAGLCAAPVLLLAGLAASVPVTAAAAGITAVLAVTAAASWPSAGGTAGFGRALLFSSAPLTLSFQVLAAAAVAAFARAEAAPDVVASLPWAVLSALLPVALAGAILAAALGARHRPAGRRRMPEVVTWGLAGISLVLGSEPAAVGWVAGGSFGGSGRPALLAGAAVLLGAVAALTLGQRGPDREVLEEVPLAIPGPVPGGRTVGVVLDWSSGLLWVATVAAVAWVTALGLRAGFL